MNLIPLEEAVVSKSDSISAKWKEGMVIILHRKKVTIVDSQEISGKWASGSGYVKPNSEEKRKKLASSISEKFKKARINANNTKYKNIC